MIARFALVLLAAFSAAGCAVFENPMKPGLPWMPGKDGDVDQAVRLNAVWTEAVMHRQGETPKRGVGARVFFYPVHNPEADPIKAKGQLEIYVYEEEGRDMNDPKPDRKFVFPAEEIAKRHVKDDLGHSYNIFVPYDDAGGPRKKISIYVRFVPEVGPVIISDPSKITLPGVDLPGKPEELPTPTVQSGTVEAGVVQASYSDPASTQPVHPEAKVETTTIDVRSLRRPSVSSSTGMGAAYHAAPTTQSGLASTMTTTSGPIPTHSAESRSPLPSRPAPTGPIALPARGRVR